MKNRMWIDGWEVLSKVKRGRRSILLLDNGAECASTWVNGTEIEIECHNCNKKVNVNLYSYRFATKYICLTCARTGEGNSFFGKKHSEEFKERLSKERKGKWKIGADNFWYGKNIWDRYSNDKRDELKRQFSERQKGDGNSFYGKKHSEEAKAVISKKSKKYLLENPSHLKKMISRSLNKQKGGFKSSIEKIVQLELDRRGIQYKYSKVLHRKYQFDFIIGDNVLLEVNGDFWHANPKIYGNGKKELCDVQKKKLELDARKKEYAEKYGYKIFYIWESEIREKNFSVINEAIVANQI